MEDTISTLPMNELLNNNQLRGSLFSTIKCECCGKKMRTIALGNELFFYCPECDKTTGEYKVRLKLEEIAAIINFNPLL